MTPIRTLLASLALVAVTSGELLAGDWAHWRGPEQNGISRETNLVDDWDLENKKNLLWVSEIGGRATPIVLNGRVYLNCKTRHNAAKSSEKVDAQQQVVCWDAENGAVLWKDVFNVAQSDIPHPRVGWAAMVGDTETGNVYVHTVDSQLRCYTPDGKVVWSHDMTSEYGTITGYGGRTQTPIIDEDRLIVSFLAANWGDTKGPAPAHYYYAFDKKTGDLQWVSAPGGAPNDTNYSCPVVAVINGQRLLIGGNADGGVHAMQARTGEHVWSFRMSKRGLNASVVVEGDTVYVTHGEDNIDTNSFGRITAIDGTMTGDITPEGNVPGESNGQKWRVNDLKAGYASPIVKDGILYVVDDGGDLYSYDAETGKHLWKHDLGTVGKGSPVWADGKIYVMEVSGNIHIVEPSRDGCKQLSKVTLLATDPAAGQDEIYASPAIANGRVYFCTRDRLICIGNGEAKDGEVPAMPEEKPAGDEAALIQLRPYEVALNKGDSAEYSVVAFDANGRQIDAPEAELAVGEGLDGVSLDGNALKTGDVAGPVAGKVTATAGELTASARVRVFPPLPWNYDFTGLKGIAVPPTWVRAHIKIKPGMDGEEAVMVNAPGKGRPSIYVHMGPPDMKGYETKADFKFEGKRQLSYAGITVQKYNFIAKANTNKLEIQSWAPHLRMATTQKMRFKDGVWYTMRFQVDVEDGTATCRGKIWEREKDEPKDWTIEATDPHANEAGAPGLFFYTLDNTYVDNVSVTPR